LLTNEQRETRERKTACDVVDYVYLTEIEPGFRDCSGTSIWKMTALRSVRDFIGDDGHGLVRLSSRLGEIRCCEDSMESRAGFEAQAISFLLLGNGRSRGQLRVFFPFAHRKLRIANKDADPARILGDVERVPFDRAPRIAGGFLDVAGTRDCLGPRAHFQRDFADLECAHQFERTMRPPDFPNDKLEVVIAGAKRIRCCTGVLRRNCAGTSTAIFYVSRRRRREFAALESLTDDVDGALSLSFRDEGIASRG